MSFFLAPALVTLRDEVNARFPNRDKASDGWIGDASHQARPSDHNPCWSCSGRSHGIVRALDIDISPDGRPNVDLRKRLLKVLIGDPRVWYVISNGIIYSRTHGWAARKYTGSNPHFAHVHVSLNGANGVDSSNNFDTSPWFPKHKKKPAPEPKDDGKFSRVENFWLDRNNWDLKILDRAAKNGRDDIQRKLKQIDRAIKGLPDDKGDTRVTEFVEAYEEKRVLKLGLLREAMTKGNRTGAVKDVFGRLNQIINSLPRS